MFPLFLKMYGRLAVVVGGGRVGQRKVRSLLESQARVRVVCLENCPAEFTHPDVEWLQQRYMPEHLKDASLVFAAATPDVNQRVTADARTRDIWVNRGDDQNGGDFY